MSAVEIKPKLYRAEDLERLPDDGRHYELIKGELREMPPPGEEHGQITMSLSARLTVFVDDNELGVCFAAETGFVLAFAPDTVKAPDWAFIKTDRLSRPLTPKYSPTVPDIVLETRSPNDTRKAVATKIQEWLDFGVQVVWELNPATKILTVHRADGTVTTLTPADTLTEETLLPGFSLPLVRVFR